MCWISSPYPSKPVGIFSPALQDIIKYRKSDPLNEELERVFLEIQLGIQRRDALKNMANRVRQNDLSTVIDSLIQADEFGVSIGAILHVLAEQMRSKRFNRAEKLANEAPVKILIPLVLFIFPAILIIFLGPVFMHALRNM